MRHAWSDDLMPPTMGDAAAAASSRAAQGAGEVLVFGSVARGDQRNGSDIDLVAVFDDLDYAQTPHMGPRLGDEARRAAGCEAEVEVFVTDRPEWAHRTRKVASSFEAQIAAEAIALFARPAAPGAVRWGKQISRPADDRAEAHDRLQTATRHLLRVSIQLIPSERQMQAAHTSSEQAARDIRRWSLWEVCCSSSMAARSAIAAVFAAEGRYAPRELDVAQLADLLPSKHRAVADAAWALDATEVDRWHGVCNSDECREKLPLDEQARIARTLAGPAADLVTAAADILESNGAHLDDVEDARKYRSYIREFLRGCDIATGLPLAPGA